MNKIVVLMFVVALTACERSEPAETVESLMTDSERLKVLQRECKLDRAKLGNELCNRVAEAASRRFFGDGKVPYNTPTETPKF